MTNYEIISLEEQADRVHNNITKIYITDTLKHYNLSKWEDLTICEKQKLVDWAYYIYFKQELNISLGCICDSTFEHRKQILADKYDKRKFIDILANRWLDY